MPFQRKHITSYNCIRIVDALPCKQTFNVLAVVGEAHLTALCWRVFSVQLSAAYGLVEHFNLKSN